MSERNRPSATFGTFLQQEYRDQDILHNTHTTHQEAAGIIMIPGISMGKPAEPAGFPAVCTHTGDTAGKNLPEGRDLS